MKAEPTASGTGATGTPDPREDTRADTHLIRSLLIGIFILMAVYA
ncbi:AI-2E family transporter, partial [Mesorhizobium sp. USDA-HM6]